MNQLLLLPIAIGREVAGMAERTAIRETEPVKAARSIFLLDKRDEWGGSIKKRKNKIHCEIKMLEKSRARQFNSSRDLFINIYFNLFIIFFYY